MFKFDNNPATWQRLDYQIMSRGFLKPHRDETDLQRDIDWLKSEEYKIIEIDCEEWNNKEYMFDSLYHNLGYYFSQLNFDALEEFLGEIEIPNYCMVVLIRNIEKFDIKKAHTLVDVFISSARRRQLFNDRLLILLKIEDTKFQLNTLGAFNMHLY